MSFRVHVATRKGLFTVDRTSTGFRLGEPHFLGDPVTVVQHDPRDGAVYAAVGHGHFGAKLHRSRDRGATFQEIAAPAYPPKPEGRTDRDGSGREIPWSVRQIWALAPGAASRPGVLWCGTIPGGLFRSDDHGDSWHLNQPLWDHEQRQEWFGGGADWPGIHSVTVDPRNADHVILGVSCGGVWVSEDDGQSWTCQADGMRAAYMPPELAGQPFTQDPHRVVQCAAAPDVLWAQHHNGIFRSTDRARSWHEVYAEPSSFGFAVAVHPSDGDTAWFVPAIKDELRVPVDGKLVVTRTRDGGRSFETLSQGLPQERAYDLVYRHALDVDDTGDCLAFGSTTGGLWLSEDQGDSWHLVSAHLPPIYAVAFEKSSSPMA